MIKPLLILSTCGTSLFTNGADGKTRHWLTSITNQRHLEGEDANRLDHLVSRCRARLDGADSAERRR